MSWTGTGGPHPGIAAAPIDRDFRGGSPFSRRRAITDATQANPESGTTVWGKPLPGPPRDPPNRSAARR